MADDAGGNKPPSLEEFSKRFEAARGPVEQESDNQRGEGAQMGQGLRVASELLAAFLVGGGLGWGLDRLLGTKPWLLLVGIGLGFAAGILNVIRAMEEMDRDQDAQSD